MRCDDLSRGLKVFRVICSKIQRGAIDRVLSQIGQKFCLK